MRSRDAARTGRDVGLAATYTLLMHVGIDIREACGPRPTGKGRWTEGFVRRGVRVSLFTDAPVPEAWRGEVKTAGANAVVLPAKGLRWHTGVAQMLKPSGIDCYISPTSYIVPALAGSSVRCVPVVHDLIAFRSEKHDRRATLIERFTLGRAVKSAYRVCTVSDATRADLLARYPRLDGGRVRAVYAGGGELPEAPSVSDGKTIICIGTLCPRKNQLRLIRAFDRLPSPLRERSRLVLVGGRGWDDQEIVRLASSTAGVEWKDYLPQSDCDELLAHAAVFAYPSLYEGFGFPLLDAMRRRIPALTSDRGSIREVAGDAALYVNPEDEGAISQGLERLLADAEFGQKLASEGQKARTKFTWSRTVDLFLEGLDS